MKRNFKKIDIALTILLVVVIFVCVYKFINTYIYNHEVYKSETYNYKFDLIYFNNGKVCLKLKSSGKYASPRVDCIFDKQEDSLAIYKNNSKSGYININTGKIAIPAENFDYAWDFDIQSGLAAVSENNKLGFINREGKYVILPQYNYYNCIYKQKEFGFVNGYSLVPDSKTHKLGLIDIKNKMLLKPIFDEISKTNFGLYLVTLNNKMGLADSLFNFVLKPQYDKISLNNQGIIITDYKTNRQYLLSYDYKTIISEFAFDQIEKIYKTYGNKD